MMVCSFQVTGDRKDQPTSYASKLSGSSTLNDSSSFSHNVRNDTGIVDVSEYGVFWVRNMTIYRIFLRFALVLAPMVGCGIYWCFRCV